MNKKALSHMVILIFILVLSPFTSANCGDGFCDKDECNNCQNDCMPSDCQGNNVCDTTVGENCKNSNDCACSDSFECAPERKESDHKGCYKISCGDGFVDWGENRNSCCIDTGCIGKKVCGSNGCKDCYENSDCSYGVCDIQSNTCVGCTDDTDCEGGFCNPENQDCVECLNNEQCKDSTRWFDSSFCSPDSKTVMQRGAVINGICDLNLNKCIGEREETTRTSLNCEQKGTFCQDGSCGCSDGYFPCESVGACTKYSDKTINEHCSCDLECDTGFCGKSGICIKPISFLLSADKTNQLSSKETIITLSVENSLDVEADSNIVLNIGSGAHITNVISGMHCSGNQCKISMNIGARSRTDITVGITSDHSTSVPISSEIFYVVEDKEFRTQNENDLTITFSDCGNGKCEYGEDMSNCCLDCGCSISSNKFIENKCNKNLNVCEEKKSIIEISRTTSIWLVSFAFGVIFLIKLFYFGKFVSKSRSSVRDSMKLMEDEDDLECIEMPESCIYPKNKK